MPILVQSNSEALNILKIINVEQFYCITFLKQRTVVKIMSVLAFLLRYIESLHFKFCGLRSNKLGGKPGTFFQVVEFATVVWQIRVVQCYGNRLFAVVRSEIFIANLYQLQRCMKSSTFLQKYLKAFLSQKFSKRDKNIDDSLGGARSFDKKQCFFSEKMLLLCKNALAVCGWLDHSLVCSAKLVTSPLYLLVPASFVTQSFCYCSSLSLCYLISDPPFEFSFRLARAYYLQLSKQCLDFYQRKQFSIKRGQ